MLGLPEEQQQDVRRMPLQLALPGLQFRQLTLQQFHLLCQFAVFVLKVGNQVAF